MTIEDNKISRIYQQADQKTDQECKEQGPSLDLDNAILKTAHDAVEQIEDDDISDEFSKVKSPFAGGWHARISIAALLLITVIIVPLIEQEEAQSPDIGKLDMYEQEKHKLEKMRKLSGERDSTSRLKLKEQSAKRAVQSPMAEPSPKIAASVAPKVVVKPEATKKHSPMQRQLMKQEMKFIPYSTEAVESDGATSDKLPAVEVETIEMMHNTSSTAGPFSSETMLHDDSAADLYRSSPDSWLKEIRQLLEDDEYDRAKIELEQFKLIYPQEVIDPFILQQIAEHH